MEKLKIELTVNDWNAVLAVLGARPFNEVAGLITEIKQQASVQMSVPQTIEAEAA